MQPQAPSRTWGADFAASRMVGVRGVKGGGEGRGRDAMLIILPAGKQTDARRGEGCVALPDVPPSSPVILQDSSPRPGCNVGVLIREISLTTIITPGPVQTARSLGWMEWPGHLLLVNHRQCPHGNHHNCLPTAPSSPPHMARVPTPSMASPSVNNLLPPPPGKFPVAWIPLRSSPLPLFFPLPETPGDLRMHLRLYEVWQPGVK